MPTRGEVNVYTDSLARDGKVQKEFLNNGSTTGKLVRARAQMISTAPGSGVSYKQELEVAQGGHYSDYDERETIQKRGEPIEAKAEWIKNFADLSIAGTRLEDNANLTTSYLLDDPGSLLKMGDAQLTQLNHILEEEVQRGLITMFNNCDYDVWEIPIPDDPNPSRGLGKGLPSMWNEDATYNGLGPDAYGVWEAGSKWEGDNNPSSLSLVNFTARTAQKYKYRNVPQVLQRKEVDSSTAINVDVITEAMLVMADRISGFMAAPATISHFNTLYKEIRDSGQLETGFLRLGMGTAYALSIQVIKIQQCFIYVDSRASAEPTKFRAFHVGNSVEGGGDMDAPGFMMKMWMNPKSLNVMAQANQALYEADNFNNAAGPLFPMGQTQLGNIGSTGWNRQESGIDTIYNTLTQRHCFGGARWKNLVIEGLSE